MAEAFTLVVTGLRGTIAGLNLAVATTVAKGTAALEAGARIIQVKARANMATHHYTGRAESATQVSVPVVDAAQTVHVKVGILPGTWAPEGNTFEFGWHSKKGKQPPNAPIAEWLMRRGIVSNDSEAKRVAFVVGRKMKEDGYSFGTYRWLDQAAQESMPAVVSAVTVMTRL